MTAAEAEANPERLPFEFAEHERGRSVNELWEEATRDLRDMVEREGAAAWDKIVAQYDKDSLREFMTAKGFSEGAIEAYGVLNFVEAELNSAVVEELREDIGKAYVDMQEIVGGMDRLPNAFYNELQDVIRFGAEVTAIDQDPHSVTVHYQTKFGRFSVTGDYAICSIPFSVLQTVEAIKPFSRPKQRAIRQLYYAASTKILFQVRRRRWEELDGIYGGATVTDLAIRRMNYPTPNPENRAASCWPPTRGARTPRDGARWTRRRGSSRRSRTSPGSIPWIGEEFEVGASHAWYDDPWARGAFALFEPEQQTNLQADIVKPEGRVHFAGEHTSLYHAWIQGALESGIRPPGRSTRRPPSWSQRQSGRSSGGEGARPPDDSRPGMVLSPHTHGAHATARIG